MADLKTIVQRMIAAGEPEENIAIVIKSYNEKKATGSTTNAAPVEPNPLMDYNPIAAYQKNTEPTPKVGELISENGFSDLKKLNKTREAFGYKPLKELPNQPVSLESQEEVINYMDDQLLPGAKYSLEIKDEVKTSYDRARKAAPKSEFGTLNFEDKKSIEKFQKDISKDFFKNNKIFNEKIIPEETKKLQPKLEIFISETKKEMGLDDPANVTEVNLNKFKNKIQKWYNNNLNKAVSLNPEFNRLSAALNKVTGEIQDPELKRYLRGKDSPTLLKVMDMAESSKFNSFLPIETTAKAVENLINSGRGIANSLAKTGVNLGLSNEVEKEKSFNTLKNQIIETGNEDIEGAWIVDDTDIKNSFRFIPKKNLYTGEDVSWRMQVSGREYKEGSFKEFEKQFNENKFSQYSQIGKTLLDIQEQELALQQWNDDEFQEILKGNDVVSNAIGLAADQLPQMGLALVTLGVSSSAQIGGDIYSQGIDIEAAKRFNLKEGETPTVNQRAEILKDEEFMSTLEAKALGGGLLAGQLERFGAGKTIKAFSKSTVTSLLRGGYKNFLKGVANNTIANTQTGATEAITEIIQETIQATASGAEIDVNQLIEAGGTGFITSALFGVAGNIKSQTLNEVKSASRLIAGRTKENSTEALFNAKIKEIDLAIEEATDNNDIKDLKLKKQAVVEAKNANASVPKDLNSKNKVKAIDLIIEKNKLQKEIEGIDPELVKNKKEKIDEINKKLQILVLNNEVDKKVDEAKNKAKKILDQLDGDTEVIEVSQDNAEGLSVKDQIINVFKKAGLTEKQIKAQIKNDAAINFGFFVTDSKDPNKEYLVLNKDQIAKYGRVSTAQHEVLHKILKNKLKNNPELAKQLHDNIQSEVNRMKPDVAEVFNKIMESYMQDVNNPDMPNYTIEKYYEEYFVQFSEFVENNNAKLNSNIITKLKDIIRRIFNRIGFRNINFDNDNAINFIKDYNKEFRKGRLSKASIELANENIKNLNSPGAVTAFSKAIEIDENTKKDIFSRATEMYETYKDDISSAGLMVGLEFDPIVRKMLNKYKDLYGMDDYTLDLIANDVMIETRPGYNGIPDLVKTWDPSKGASLTSHIYGNLPKRILGIIQRKYPDLGRMTELVPEKADKLTTDQGIGGGFVDVSSPEAYTRVSQKKAEKIMGMPKEYITRAEQVGERILMSTKLEDLDARTVGTIIDSEGRTLRVAMLPGNKAKVYFPDGTNETIPARTPKVVEQKYGAPEKSFTKIATTKAQMINEARAYLIPEIEKTAGGLKDNYTPTQRYIEFVDKVFPLYKDYLSQSAINKRFTDFKEPVIDPKTGKQAREKTAQGNKIFTKKPIVLAEWRKYFIGDGTMRIDGRRRSLLEALAQEQGFDKVMEALSKEDFRKQIESRQEELNVDLIDNYVALVAKSLDRNNPTVEFSKFTEDLAAMLNRKQEDIENDLVNFYYNNKNKNPHFVDIPDEDLREAIKEVLGEKIKLQIEDSKSDLEKANSRFKTELKKLTNLDKDVLKGFNKIESASKSEIVDFENSVKEITSHLPQWTMQLTRGSETSVKAPFMAGIFGHSSRENKATKTLYNRELYEENNYEIAGTKFNQLSKSTQELWNNLKEELEANNTEGSGLSLGFKAKQLIKKDLFKIQQNKNLTIEQQEKAIMSPALNNKRKQAAIDNKLKVKFLKAFLNTIAEISENLEGNSRLKYIQGISKFFSSNDNAGIRFFSPETYVELGEGDFSEIKNEHLLSKLELSVQVIKMLYNGKLDSFNIDELVKKYVSVSGSKKGQKVSDAILGATIKNAALLKMITSKLKKGSTISEAEADVLKSFFNWETGKTRYEELLESEYNKEIDNLVQDAKAKKENNSIINNTKDNVTVKPSKITGVDKKLAEMIERKTGISAKAPLSAARAANIGANKGRFSFYLPPNAEDFAGLMYKLYGKGKQGDEDMAFIKEVLLDPYNAGEQAISTYKQNLAEDYKAIEKQLGEISTSVSKETKAALEDIGFSADQAVRVALWNQAGFEIPGIQNIEAAKLRVIVTKDKRLKAYADGIRAMVKGNLFEPKETWFSSNIRYDLFTHATEGVRGKFLEEFNENVKEIFTKENLVRLEAAFGKDYVKNLEEILERMRTGKSRGTNIGSTANKALDYLNGSVGVIMWMNTRSAMLQTISAVNYLNWTDNNPIKVAQALSKPKEFAATFMEIYNSDFLKQRRSGLEINIEEAEIARAVEKSKGKAASIFNSLIKAGFKPTQIADSFAIAIGGTPLLMNRTKTYEAQGLDYKAAREKAFNDLREISEENQQSSRQDKVSNIQTGLLGRLVFAFNNTPMQMTRLQKKAILDLKNRRGDWKTNLSKLVYYSTIQSMIFYTLQQGLFLSLFGKDDEDLTEEEKENLEKFKNKKAVGMANSVIDSFLSGSGMPGKVTVTLKNTLLRYINEEKKGYRADYWGVIEEALKISPVISSKTSKAYSAFKTFKYTATKKGKKQLEQYDKLSPFHPHNIARAKIFSAATNVPLDRVLRKMENLNEAAFNSEIEPIIRVALAAGWDKWSLGFYDGVHKDLLEKEIIKEAKSKKSYDRKAAMRKKALDFSKKSFRYRDSVRLAKFRQKQKNK